MISGWLGFGVIAIICPKGNISPARLIRPWRVFWKGIWKPPTYCPTSRTHPDSYRPWETMQRPVTVPRSLNLLRTLGTPRISGVGDDECQYYTHVLTIHTCFWARLIGCWVVRALAATVLVPKCPLHRWFTLK